MEAHLVLQGFDLSSILLCGGVAQLITESAAAPACGARSTVPLTWPANGNSAAEGGTASGKTFLHQPNTEHGTPSIREEGTDLLLFKLAPSLANMLHLLSELVRLKLGDDDSHADNSGWLDLSRYRSTTGFDSRWERIF